MLPDAAFTLQEGALHVVPICPHRLEFAHAVRRAILAVRPAAVALELPAEICEAYVEAVKRFPYLSVIVQQNVSLEEMLLWHVEPTDPFAEAVRTALEAEIPVHFIDLTVREYPAVHEAVPDAYAVYHIGLKRFWDEYEAAEGGHLHEIRKLPSDLLRFGGLDLSTKVRTLVQAAAAQGLERASHVANCVSDLMARQRPREVLLVCDISHVREVMRHVRDGSGRRGRPAPVKSVQIANPDLGFIRATSEEIPFLIATYEFDRKGAGPDHAWEPKKDEPPPRVESTPLDALSRDDVVGALESLLGLAPKETAREMSPTPEFWRALSRKLRGIRDPSTVLELLGGNSTNIPHLLGAPGSGPEGHRIFKFRSVEDRRPALRGHYSDASALRSSVHRMLDRQRVMMRMMRIAADFYNDNTGEELKRWQFRTMTQFIRSYARLRGQLLPRGWWDWTVAARGVCDDNYAYEVWDLASFYPWIDESGPHPRLTVDGETIKLNLREIRFRRRWPRFREGLVKAPVRPRKQEPHAGDWAKEFESGTICSYPPEDILIEDYGRYLKKKALLVLSEERTRTEPFSTSLLDGIDVRETIRNWPDRRRIFVREMQKVKGGAGSVVVIFDEDVDDSRYPWRMTWHGEHAQESDMAFYATAVYAKVVGPGIARCEYGGMMLTYPPRRVMDVWSDPFYHEAKTKAEVLLLAGLEYSLEKHVVYVSAKPPRGFLRSLANRLGKKIIYLPIGQLSPVSVKKLRVFHVLSGHYVRDFAKDYIW